MDMRNLLNKLNGLLAENEAGPIKQCVSCGEKAHVDHTTGMCVDCLTKAEEEQGLSESPMSRAPADTKMKAKKCAFCGGNIVGRGKTTEKGDTICKDCDDYYAFDGPGGEEPDLSESYEDDEEYDFNNGDSVRVKDAGPHSEVFTLSQYEPGARRAWIGDKQGRGWYISPSRLEKVEDVDSDDNDYDDEELDEASHAKKLIKTYKSIDGKEFQLYSDPKTGYNTLMFGNDEVDEWYDHVPTDSAIDTIIDGYLDNLYSDKELDEASATKHAMYGQMRKSSRPANYKPEEHGSDKSSGMRDLGDTDDLDYIDSMIAHSSDPESNPAPWGMKSGGTSCWGCGQDWKENWSAEDLSPGEGYEEYGLDADDKICPDCAEDLTGGELNETAMCEDCGASPCACEDPLAEKKLTGPEKRKREELVKSMKGAEWEERYPGRGEEVMYATATKKAKKLAETEELSEEDSWWYNEYKSNPLYVRVNSPSVRGKFKIHNLEEVSPNIVTLSIQVRGNHSETDINLNDPPKFIKFYSGNMPVTARQAFKLFQYATKKEVEEAKECKCEGECKCKDKQLDEMRQLAGLMECGEMWDAPVNQAPAVDLQKSKMTVTTSMDSEAGTKQVTVTAEGDGADELMRVLQMAGINVAPTGNMPVDEELANEPNPQTLDSKSMLIDLSGGPNSPHGQYNPDRARDNSMTMVGEAVDNLAARLKAKFNSQK